MPGTCLKYWQVWVWALLVSSLAGLPAAATDGAGEAPADRGPILLRKTIMLPPAESAGSGLAPEVKVRVQIDDRGKVAAVEVLDIDPSSELDEAFRQQTIDELMRWRYVPAMADGAPTATQLEWTVQFQLSSVGAEKALSSFIPPDLKFEQDAAAGHARLLSLPVKEQTALLVKWSKLAEGHLQTKHRRQVISNRFVVVTDSPEPATADIVASNLEVVLSTLAELLQPEIDVQPSQLKTVVYVFANNQAMRSAMREVSKESGQPFIPRPAYFRPGLLIASLEAPSSDYLLSTLIHEAVHSFSDHHLRRQGYVFPRWFEEGFAEYMANSRVKKGQLQVGRTLQKRFVLTHGYTGARLADTRAGLTLDEVKRGLRQGEGSTLAELAQADHLSFYGDDEALNYGMSWLVMHFLRHGEPTWADDAFPTFVLYLAEGYPAGSALKVAYGTTFEALQEPFLDYVKQF